MARARNIKPGLYKNEDLAECSIWARYIFPGLWTLADRDGRLEDRPKRIKAELLPFDTQDVEALLSELAQRQDADGVPFILRYRNEDGRFIQISKFVKHQSPHYSEKPSVIKPPEFRELHRHQEASTPENSRNDTPIKTGAQPPDSLIHRFSDSPTPETKGAKAPDATTVAPKKPRRLPVAIEQVRIPEPLDIPMVRHSLGEWLEYHRSIRKPYHDPAHLTRLLEPFVSLGAPAFVAAVNHSIANQWVGLFPPGGKRERPRQGAGVNFDAADTAERRF